MSAAFQIFQVFSLDTLLDGDRDILPSLGKPKVGGLPSLLYYHLLNPEYIA